MSDWPWPTGWPEVLPRPLDPPPEDEDHDDQDGR
jgi:hypothetical protein